MGNNIEVTMNEIFQNVFLNISCNYLYLPGLNIGIIVLNKELQILKRGNLLCFLLCMYQAVWSTLEKLFLD